MLQSAILISRRLIYGPMCCFPRKRMAAPVLDDVVMLLVSVHGRPMGSCNLKASGPNKRLVCLQLAPPELLVSSPDLAAPIAIFEVVLRNPSLHEAGQNRV